MSFYFEFPELKRKSKAVYDCNKCGIKEKSKNPLEFEITTGPSYDGLVILGQIPSKNDVKKQIPFTNEESGILRSTALKNGINLAKQSAMLFALSCYTKKATETQFRCCREKLKQRLLELKPKVIICCGEMSFKYLFDLKNKYAVSKLRGRLVPNFEFNCLVYVVYSPDYIYYQKNYDDDDSLKSKYDLLDAYKKDLERIFSLWKRFYHKRTNVNTVLKERKILNNITITEIKTLKEATDIFDLIDNMKNIAFDYEATNASPYDDDFEVVYFAFGNATNSWVLHEDLWLGKPVNQRTIKKRLIRILENDKILKIIQNSKFEDLVSRFWLGIKGISNVFCTMLATHTIDERRGCTSQDFQNLIRFGIPPYNETIKKYIEPEEGEKVNRIREANKDDMIQYNGLDTITCYHNWLVLDRVLLNDPKYPKARASYEFLLNGHKAFANMTQRGICIGEKEFDKLKQFIDSEMEKCIYEIENIPEVIEYNKHLESKIVTEEKKTDLLKEVSKRPKRKFTLQKKE